MTNEQFQILSEQADRAHLKDVVWLLVCFDLSRLGTCARRKVGCVFLDQYGHVVSSGYNGPAPGQRHCISHPCKGASFRSGTGLDECEAIHAEQNALSQCTRPQEVMTVYCTDSPCITCTKVLATTSAQRIVFAREYPHPHSKAYWEGLGRKWDYLPMTQWGNQENI